MERIVILGAGGVGSAATRFLASEGHRPLVLEQFAPDHDRGSSFGASRIIRRVYPDRFYTGLMDAAYPLWEELERDAGEALLLRTGGLFFGPDAHPEMAAVRDALDAHNVPYKSMDAAETRRRFPAFRLRPEETGIFQSDGGILRASACVRANLRLAAEAGADIHAQAPVERIEPGPESVRLHQMNGETLHADRLIVAAGAWMKPLLAPYVPLPLRVTRQVYCHFEIESRPEAFDMGRFPIWIDFGRNFYGFPRQSDAPGVKVALHEPGQPTDPDATDRDVHDSDREPLRRYCAERLPDLSPQVVLEKVCLYTNTPDEDFIVDRLPLDPRVILVSGCSGHGFKFTVLLGRIAAWMATDATLPFDLSRFRLSRFEGQ